MKIINIIIITICKDLFLEKYFIIGFIDKNKCNSIIMILTMYLCIHIDIVLYYEVLVIVMYREVNFIPTQTRFRTD